MYQMQQQTYIPKTTIYNPIIELPKKINIVQEPATQYSSLELTMMADKKQSVGSKVAGAVIHAIISAHETNKNN